MRGNSLKPEPARLCMTEGAGGQRAAAVGERRDRVGRVCCLGIPHKEIVRLAEPVIDPRIPLILVLCFIGDAAVVVSRSIGRGQRIPLKQRQGHWIHPAFRHGHGAGQQALSLKQRGHSRYPNPPDGVAGALVVSKEKSPAADGRAAQHEAELITPEPRLA